MYNKKEVIAFKFKFYMLTVLYFFLSFLIFSIAIGLEKILSGNSILKWSIISLSATLSYMILHSYAFIERRKLTEKITYYLQRKYLANSLSQDYKILEKQNSGEWLTRLFSDTAIVSNFHTNDILIGLSGLFEFSFALLYGIVNSIELTVVIVLCSLLSFLVPKLLEKRITMSKEDSQIKKEAVNGFINNTFDNLPVIKSFQSFGFILSLFTNTYSNYVNSHVNNKKAIGLNEAISQGLGEVVNIIWLIAGIYLIQIDKISLPILLGFISLTGEFMVPFNRIPPLFSNYFEMKVAKERLEVTLDLDNKKTFNLEDDVTYMLKINKLSFSYDGINNVVKNSSFKVKKGEKVSVIGESGSGKTTTIKVLCGLYNNYDGIVTWNKNYRLTYVPQVITLFNGTIKENLCFFDDRILDKDIEKACKTACIYDFIISLNKGFDTIVYEEINLSYGQIQRIALARSLLYKANVFILDEFSSAIDIPTQETIFDNLKNEDSTFIMILHKQEAIDFSDRSIII